jgi:urease accessory protein
MNTRLLASALMFLPTLAHAHPGHGAGGFAGGFVHPLMGLDHLLAVVAVGLWAAQLGGVSRWLLPSSFVAAMGLSLLAGASGFSMSRTEALVAVSVVVLGGLVAIRARVAPGFAAAITILCAFFHGLAHASEMPAAGAAGFSAGLFSSTALLHLGGLAAGVLLIAMGRSRWLQFAGAAFCAAILLLGIG